MGKKLTFFFLAILFLLSGCYTTKINTDPGYQEINYPDGTIIKNNQPGNSETPAVLNHSRTDAVVAVSGERVIDISELGNTSINLDAGDTIHVTSQQTSANSGNSRENPMFKINAIMQNTKAIQYTGIGLIVLGVGLVVIFKVRYQALLLSALGIGMIILQSTLANPLWSWVLIIGVVLLPLFWLYHLYKNNDILATIVISIEELSKNRPEAAKEIKDILNKNMNKSHKIHVSLLKSAKKY